LQYRKLGHPYFTSNRNLDGRHEEKAITNANIEVVQLTKEFNIMSGIINTKNIALPEDMLAMQKTSDIKNYELNKI
jgi:hypothetical protein